MARSGPQTPARARDDSAAVPQADHTLPHELCAHSVHADPSLATVIATWPSLAEDIRATILQLIATGEVRYDDAAETLLIVLLVLFVLGSGGWGYARSGRHHRRQAMPKLKRFLLVVLAGVLWAAGGAAEPQRVRLPEGNVHGFLMVRTLAGEVIAYGELVQQPTRSSRAACSCTSPMAPSMTKPWRLAEGRLPARALSARPTRSLVPAGDHRV